jgi:bacterioferritin-associated ferredoxin
MSTSNEKKYIVEMPGRDRIEVLVEASSLANPKVQFRGCRELMDLMQSMRKNFGANPTKWPVPGGDSHSEMLLRELVLKLRGEWFLAYKEAEVCHCRKVSAATVDQAILAGAHTPQIVSRQTSASTACGTCRPDVERMIQHRLHAGLPLSDTASPSANPQKKTA